MERAPQMIVLGPPGAGKGTQAARLAERFGLVRIGPGEILREKAQADSPSAQRIRAIMAAGELVPDELIDQLVRERLHALSPEQGFVLDGYPRTAAEAETLHHTLSQLGRLQQRPRVVWLDVTRDELMRRLRRRRQVEGRADDAEEAIAQRLATYEARAGGVREALESWAEVIVIDGDQRPDEVTRAILHRVSGARDRPGPRTSDEAQAQACVRAVKA
jgi:adenylate kinase